MSQSQTNQLISLFVHTHTHKALYMDCIIVSLGDIPIILIQFYATVTVN